MSESLLGWLIISCLWSWFCALDDAMRCIAPATLYGCYAVSILNTSLTCTHVYNALPMNFLFV